MGDNIDKNVKPRFQRHEKQGQSFHFFHGYAVKDRVDLSELSDKPPVYTIPEPSVLIPSLTDLTSVKEELTILIARYASLFHISVQCTLHSIRMCFYTAYLCSI